MTLCRSLPIVLGALLITGGEGARVWAGRPLEPGEAFVQKPIAPAFRKSAPSLAPLQPPPEPALAPAPALGGLDDNALFATSDLSLDAAAPTAGQLAALSSSVLDLAVSPPSAAPPKPAPPALPPKPAPVLTPAQRRLLEMARKVAPTVVALSAWDGFGNQLAEGCGFFLNDHGAILTDLQLVSPEFAARIEYITVATGSGGHHRITGFWGQDTKTGLTLLQSDARDTPFTLLSPESDFAAERPVALVALSPTIGLTLADATMRADPTTIGAGWLNLRGEDSPGQPGSPIISADGRVVGVVSMRVPQGQWFNFGLRIDTILPVLEKIAVGEPQPLAGLIRSSKSAKDDPRFVAAFQTLHAGQLTSGVSQLLFLLKTHPRSAEVWALLALGYQRLGAKAEALNCSRRAVALDPEIGQFWQTLAVSHMGGGKTEPNAAAREALERTVEEQPGDKVAWLLLAEQQMLGGQLREAELSLLQVLKLESDYAPASFLLGYVKIRRGELADARLLLERCLALDRRHTRAWLLLALLHTKEKRLPDAVAAYQKLLDAQPKHPFAWRNLALLERRLGHETNARLAFERHQRLGPSTR